jgi:hypothetical protein
MAPTSIKMLRPSSWCLGGSEDTNTLIKRWRCSFPPGKKLPGWLTNCPSNLLGSQRPTSAENKSQSSDRFRQNEIAEQLIYRSRPRCRRFAMDALDGKTEEELTLAADYERQLDQFKFNATSAWAGTRRRLAGQIAAIQARNSRPIGSIRNVEFKLQ